MEDIEMLKALLKTTAHIRGVDFSNTCINLLDKIIENTKKMEREKINLEKQIDDNEIQIRAGISR